jgi:glutaredoxin 2
MSNKLAAYFTMTVAVSLTLYSIFLIGRLIAGAHISLNEIQILCLLLVVNCVNGIHWPSTK